MPYLYQAGIADYLNKGKTFLGLFIEGGHYCAHRGNRIMAAGFFCFEIELGEVPV